MGLIHYPDDFLLAATDKNMQYVHGYIRTYVSQSWHPIAEDKTCRPAQELIFLSIDVDTIKEVIRLLDDQLATLMHTLRTWVIGMLRRGEYTSPTATTYNLIVL